MKHRSIINMRHRRITASCMAAVTLSMSICTPVKAAPPQVQVDETMYVNLDYYGRETQINVVKGCSTNGVTNYTDYGEYDKVVNMSDKTEPAVGDGTVAWQLPAENKRFYFQCTMPKNSVQLPWTFDVSYKLNGKQVDAEKLAGASGLIEINIKAEPNKGARAYYKNNMMLSVVVPVDMAKCYSVEAPGSQLQSMGNNTVALFAALPGEEGDYTVRIGTDSYESVGVIMMMVPGTVDALNNIKDLKEAKDTWREDGDKMYDSMNELLRTMESMKTEVTRVKGGLGSLENARAAANANRKQIENLSTQALSEMQSVTDQTVVLIPYLETAKQAVLDINDNVNAIYNTMEGTQDELDTLYDRLGSLRRSLETTSQKIGQGITFEEQKAIADSIKKQTAEIEAILAQLGPTLGDAGSLYDLTEEDLNDLNNSLDLADVFRYDRKIPKKDAVTATDTATDTDTNTATDTDTDTDTNADNETTAETVSVTTEGMTDSAASDVAEDTDKKVTKEVIGKTDVGATEKTEAGTVTDTTEHSDVDSGTVQAFGNEEAEDALIALLRKGPSGMPGTGGVNETSFEEWSDEEIDEYADDTEEALQSLRSTGYQSAVGDLLSQIGVILGNGESVQKTAGEVIGRVNSVCADIGDTGHQTAKTLAALRRVTDELVNLMDDSRVLIDTMNGYVPSMTDSLGATEELMNRLTRAMNSTHALLSLVNDTMIAAGDSLDQGTKDSLAGMTGLLDRSLKILDDTAAVRLAGEGMKETLDEQLDKFEDENNFLNMDPEADMISFTSSKNPSPHSLQIIVRTDEISIDNDSASIADMEDADSEEINPFVRMWRVLVKIVQSIADIFKNR